jgi:D-alanyl-D-alanine carboxypeptidase
MTKTLIIGIIVAVLLVVGAVGTVGAVWLFNPEKTAVDEETVQELSNSVKDVANDQAGGILVRLDMPNGDLTLAEGPSADEAFRIGSVTKLFTAAVVMQLAEEEVLGLDDPLPEVLPEHADRFEFGEQITVRQLLGHTAGLDNLNDNPAFFNDFIADLEVADGVASNACVSREERNTLSYASEEGLFEPGTNWAYSNTGYIVLGEIIEAASGQPLHDVYRERILDRLGMEHTWLACDEEPRVELARGYLEPGDFPLPGQGDAVIDVTDVTFSDAWSGGGMISTADDLAVFARGLFTGELFDEAATLDAMLEVSPESQKVASPGDWPPPTGLGVEIRGDTYGKEGQILGYSAQVSYDPTTDIVVVVLATNHSVDVVSLDSEIRSILRSAAE